MDYAGRVQVCCCTWHFRSLPLCFGWCIKTFDTSSIHLILILSSYFSSSLYFFLVFWRCDAVMQTLCFFASATIFCEFNSFTTFRFFDLIIHFLYRNPLFIGIFFACDAVWPLNRRLEPFVNALSQLRAIAQSGARSGKTTRTQVVGIIRWEIKAALLSQRRNRYAATFALACAIRPIVDPNRMSFRTVYDVLDLLL